MDARSQLLTGKVVILRNAVNAAALATFPVGFAEGVDISAWRSGKSAPRSVKFSWKNDGAATLNGGYYLGWNAEEGIWEEFARVKDGQQVDFTATRGYGQILRDVPACYTHIQVIGTASAGNTTVKATPIEGDE